MFAEANIMFISVMSISWFILGLWTKNSISILGGTIVIIYESTIEKNCGVVVIGVV